MKELTEEYTVVQVQLMGNRLRTPSEVLEWQAVAVRGLIITFAVSDKDKTFFIGKVQKLKN